jgi:hypothetical protein
MNDSIKNYQVTITTNGIIWISFITKRIWVKYEPRYSDEGFLIETDKRTPPFRVAELEPYLKKVRNIYSLPHKISSKLILYLFLRIY